MWKFILLNLSNYYLQARIQVLKCRLLKQGTKEECKAQGKAYAEKYCPKPNPCVQKVNFLLTVCIWDYYLDAIMNCLQYDQIQAFHWLRRSHLIPKVFVQSWTFWFCLSFWYNVRSRFYFAVLALVACFFHTGAQNFNTRIPGIIPV